MAPFDFVRRLERRARHARHAVFARLLQDLPHPLAILDVGGTKEYWDTVGFRPDGRMRVVLYNMFEQRVASPFESAVGDARDLSRYRDKEFDVVFSNSVIGHVGSFSDQRRMASEMQRVGRHFFLQTPNHGFPVDWRTLVPFFHFLPVGTQAWCFERFPVGTYRRAVDPGEARYWAGRIRNLRRRELEMLFPGAQVVPERVCGFAKSFMAHNFPDARRRV